MPDEGPERPARRLPALSEACRRVALLATQLFRAFGSHPYPAGSAAVPIPTMELSPPIPHRYLRCPTPVPILYAAKDYTRNCEAALHHRAD